MLCTVCFSAVLLSRIPIQISTNWLDVALMKRMCGRTISHTDKFFPSFSVFKPCFCGVLVSFWRFPIGLQFPLICCGLEKNICLHSLSIITRFSFNVLRDVVMSGFFACRFSLWSHSMVSLANIRIEKQPFSLYLRFGLFWRPTAFLSKKKGKTNEKQLSRAKVLGSSPLVTRPSWKPACETFHI